MDADLDLVLTTVFVTTDDLLPGRQNNTARRWAYHAILQPDGNFVEYGPNGVVWADNATC
ncbi:MAG TPA: hypothetical protein VGF81_04075 [Solirubrobacteraceae bacterium]|jgi:hypothetical protein